MAQAGAAAIVQGTGQHGAAGDKDGGDIDAGGGHEQAGHVFIAVGDHNQAVELVGHGHGLGGVGDQVAGDQGIFHAHMAHGDAVAYGDGGELHGGAAGGADAGFDGFGDLVQIHVAGNDFVIGADHADQRALQLFLGVSQSVEQGAVWGGRNAFFDYVTAHDECLLYQ